MVNRGRATKVRTVVTEMYMGAMKRGVQEKEMHKCEKPMAFHGRDTGRRYATLT